MNLGEKLFELRKEKNLSQEAVAEKLNVTRQTISKWETNQSTPDFDKIIPICELYEISTDELLRGEKNTEEETNEKIEENINNDESANDNKFDWYETKKHLFTRGKEDEENYENMTKSQIKQKSAEVVSTSVFIYIASVAFLIIGIAGFNWNAVVVFSLFLIGLAWATERIIKHYMSIPKFEKTKEERKQDNVLKQVNSIVGTICLILYFIISFATMAWYITWVIFIIDGLICQIIKLLFALKGDEDDEE